MPYRALISYLCVILAFPSQVWGQQRSDGKTRSLSEEAKTQRPVGELERSRKELRRVLHLSAWKLSHLALAQISQVVRFDSVKYYGVIKPYEHCKNPWVGEVNLEKIDKEVIKPAQAELTAFLIRYQGDLGKTPFVFPSQIFPKIDVLTLEDGNTCLPAVYQGEIAGAQLPVPLFSSLGSLADAPLSELEVRQWVVWVSYLREYRNSLAQALSRKAGVPPVNPPHFNVPRELGALLARNLGGARAAESRVGEGTLDLKDLADKALGNEHARVLSKLIAEKILAGTKASDEIPGFRPCTELGDSGNSDWCLQDGKRSQASMLEEEILLSLNGGSGKQSHGIFLNAIRRLAMQTTLAEFAEANSRLALKERVSLPLVCTDASLTSDLKPFLDMASEIGSVGEKEWWLSNFNHSVKALERSYEEGTAQVPLPVDVMFYERAQAIARDYVESFPPLATAVNNDPLLGKRERILARLEGEKFSERIREGNSSQEGGDSLGGIIADRLRFWVTLVEADLRSLKAENEWSLKNSVIVWLLTRVAVHSLVDALGAYIVSQLGEEGLTGPSVILHWEQKKGEWEQFVEHADNSVAIQAMARSFFSGLTDSGELNKKYEPEKRARSLLSEYVKVIVPRVKEAGRAQDTIDYLNLLEEWQKDPLYNLVPGPWNYHWQLAPVIPKGTPACFHVEDGKGHGYGLTMPIPDGYRPLEYLHLKQVLSRITDRKSLREALAKKLKGLGLTGDVVAERVVLKFQKLLTGVPQEDGVTRVELMKRKFMPLIQWLRTPEAPKKYHETTAVLAKRIHEEFLLPLFESDPSSSKDVLKVGWKNQFMEVIKQIKQRSLLIQGKEELALFEELIAAYEQHLKSALFEKREQEKLIPIRGELESIRRFARDAKMFEREGQGLIEFCMSNRALCLRQLDSVASKLRTIELFRWRVLSRSERAVDQFLEHFTRLGKTYSGELPEEVDLVQTVVLTKNDLLEAWFGVPLSTEWVGTPQERERVIDQKKQVENFLSEISRVREQKDYDSAFLALRSSLEKKLEALYSAWRENLDRHFNRLKEALSPSSPSQALQESFESAVILFHREVLLSSHVESTGFRKAEQRYLSDIRKGLIPDFGQFVGALSIHLQGALSKEGFQEIPSLKTELLRLSDYYEGEKRKGMSEAKLEGLQAEISSVSQRVHAAEKRLRSFGRFTELLKLYLPNLNEEIGSVWDETLFNTYFEDQFLRSPTDAIGSPMKMTLEEVLNDLNKLAVSLSSQIAIDPEKARRFMSEIKTYCIEGMKDSAQQVFLNQFYFRQESLFKDLLGSSQRSGTARRSLARMWQFVYPTGGGFETWVEKVKAAKPESRTEIIREGLDGRQFCSAVEKADHNFKKLLDGRSEGYWGLVEAVSDLWSDVRAEFRPIIKEEGGVVGMTGSPVAEQGGEEGQSDELKITQALSEFIRLPGMDEKKLSQSVDGKIDTAGFGMGQDRIRWLNGLSMSDREVMHELLRQYFQDHGITSGFDSKLMELFAERSSEPPSFEEWRWRLGRKLDLLLHWKSASEEGLEKLALECFSDFVLHSGYRFGDKRFTLGVAPTPSRNFEEFRALGGKEKLRAIGDVRRILLASVTSDSNQLKRSFEAKGQKSIELEKPSTVALHFFIRHLMPEPSKGPSPFQRWLFHFSERIQQEESPRTVKLSHFKIKWALTGEKTQFGKDFEGWFQSLLSSDRVGEAYERLKATQGMHLWTFFKTPSEYAQSDLHRQVLGLLTVNDSNSRALPVAGTYPYFLALLNWNLNHSSQPLPEGSTRTEIPLAEEHLSKLMTHLVDILELNLKSFQSYEFLLEKTADLSDWRLLAESKKAFLVGMGESRFLSTQLGTPQVELSGNLSIRSKHLEFHPYRPLVVVDNEERSRLSSSLGFDEWFGKHEDPLISKDTPLLGKASDKEPLFVRLLRIENQMVGEQDLLEAQDSDVKSRMAEHRQGWVGFGKTDFSPRISDLIEVAKKESVLSRETSYAVAERELKPILAIREKLVDFRNTLNELNLQYLDNTSWKDSFQTLAHIKERLASALRVFAGNIGYTGKIPQLAELEDNKSSRGEGIARTQREALARAIYSASRMANEVLFAKKGEHEVERMHRILSLTDQHYRELLQVKAVQSGLKQVTLNIHSQLEKLCGASDLSEISSDEDFKKGEKRILEVGLAYYDSLNQLFFLDSGWVPDGETNETRRFLAELVKKQSRHREILDRAQVWTNWVVAAVLLATLAGKTSPAVAQAGRVVLNSAASRMGLLILNLGLAGVFTGVEVQAWYDDFYGRPDEIDLLRKIGDSQFVGDRPLMKDESVRMLEDQAHAVQRDQVSVMRWSLRMWVLGISWQMLKPVGQMALGGLQRQMSLYAPRWTFARKLRSAANAFGVSVTKDPILSGRSLTSQELENRAFRGSEILRNEYLKSLSTIFKRVRGETVYLTSEEASVIREAVRVQIAELDVLYPSVRNEVRTAWARVLNRATGDSLVLTHEEKDLFLKSVKELLTKRAIKSNSVLMNELMSLKTNLEERGVATELSRLERVVEMGTQGAQSRISGIYGRLLGASREDSIEYLKFLRDEMAPTLLAKSPVIESGKLERLLLQSGDIASRHTPFLINFLGLGPLYHSMSPRIRFLRALQRRALAHHEAQQAFAVNLLLDWRYRAKSALSERGLNESVIREMMEVKPRSASLLGEGEIGDPIPQGTDVAFVQAAGSEFYIYSLELQQILALGGWTVDEALVKALCARELDLLRVLLKHQPILLSGRKGSSEERSDEGSETKPSESSLLTSENLPEPTRRVEAPAAKSGRQASDVRYSVFEFVPDEVLGVKLDKNKILDVTSRDTRSAREWDIESGRLMAQGKLTESELISREMVWGIKRCQEIVAEFGPKSGNARRKQWWEWMESHVVARPEEWVRQMSLTRAREILRILPSETIELKMLSQYRESALKVADRQAVEKAHDFLLRYASDEKLSALQRLENLSLNDFSVVFEVPVSALKYPELLDTLVARVAGTPIYGRDALVQTFARPLAKLFREGDLSWRSTHEVKECLGLEGNSTVEATRRRINSLRESLSKEVANSEGRTREIYQRALGRVERASGYFEEALKRMASLFEPTPRGVEKALGIDLREDALLNKMCSLDKSLEVWLKTNKSQYDELLAEIHRAGKQGLLVARARYVRAVAQGESISIETENLFGILDARLRLLEFGEGEAQVLFSLASTMKRFRLTEAESKEMLIRFYTKNDPINGLAYDQLSSGEFVRERLIPDLKYAQEKGYVSGELYQRLFEAAKTCERRLPSLQFNGLSKKYLIPSPSLSSLASEKLSLHLEEIAEIVGNPSLPHRTKILKLLLKKNGNEKAFLKFCFQAFGPTEAEIAIINKEELSMALRFYIELSEFVSAARFMNSPISTESYTRALGRFRSALEPYRAVLETELGINLGPSTGGSPSTQLVNPNDLLNGRKP